MGKIVQFVYDEWSRNVAEDLVSDISRPYLVATWTCYTQKATHFATQQSSPAHPVSQPAPTKSKCKLYYPSLLSARGGNCSARREKGTKKSVLSHPFRARSNHCANRPLLTHPFSVAQLPVYIFNPVKNPTRFYSNLTGNVFCDVTSYQSTIKISFQSETLAKKGIWILFSYPRVGIAEILVGSFFASLRTEPNKMLV